MKKKGTKLFGLIAALALVVCALFAFAACDLVIRSRELQSLTLDTSEVKTTFTVGDEFTYQGLVVTANYDDGTSTVLDRGYYVTRPDLSEEGEKEVVVTYGLVSESYTINVYANELTDIRIEVDEKEKTFNVGDPFTFESLKVYAIYGEDESLYEGEVTVTINGKPAAEYVFTEEDAGSVEVTVEVLGKTATYNVTVEAAPVTVTGIKIETSGPVAFTVGDTFSTEGLVVKKTMSDGNEEDLTEGFTVTLKKGEETVTLEDNKFAEAGTYTVVVTYLEYAPVQYTVEVAPAPVVATGIRIATEGPKAFTVGDTFSTEGLVVKKTMSDGNEEDLTEGFTVTLKKGEETVTLEDNKFAEAGTYTVVVTYLEFTPAEYTIEVEALPEPELTVEQVTFNPTDVKLETEGDNVYWVIVGESNATSLELFQEAVTTLDGENGKYFDFNFQCVVDMGTEFWGYVRWNVLLQHTTVVVGEEGTFEIKIQLNALLNGTIDGSMSGISIDHLFRGNGKSHWMMHFQGSELRLDHAVNFTTDVNDMRYEVSFDPSWDTSKAASEPYWASTGLTLTDISEVVEDADDVVFNASDAIQGVDLILEDDGTGTQRPYLVITGTWSGVTKVETAQRALNNLYFRFQASSGGMGNQKIEKSALTYVATANADGTYTLKICVDVRITPDFARVPDGQNSVDRMMHLNSASGDMDFGEEIKDKEFTIRGYKYELINDPNATVSDRFYGRVGLAITRTMDVTFTAQSVALEKDGEGSDEHVYFVLNGSANTTSQEELEEALISYLVYDFQSPSNAGHYVRQDVLSAEITVHDDTTFTLKIRIDINGILEEESWMMHLYHIQVPSNSSGRDLLMAEFDDSSVTSNGKTYTLHNGAKDGQLWNAVGFYITDAE